MREGNLRRSSYDKLIIGIQVSASLILNSFEFLTLMDRIDIFQKLKRQEADAFSKLTSEERQVISQYQDRCKCESQISEENEGAKFTQIALHD